MTRSYQPMQCFIHLKMGRKCTRVHYSTFLKRSQIQFHTHFAIFILEYIIVVQLQMSVLKYCTVSVFKYEGVWSNSAFHCTGFKGIAEMQGSGMNWTNINSLSCKKTHKKSIWNEIKYMSLNVFGRLFIGTYSVFQETN